MANADIDTAFKLTNFINSSLKTIKIDLPGANLLQNYDKTLSIFITCYPSLMKLIEEHYVYENTPYILRLEISNANNILHRIRRDLRRTARILKIDMHPAIF